MKYVPDWFVRKQQIGRWDDDDELIKLYDDYNKRKDQKAQVKKELIYIDWLRSRWWNWCIPEDKERRDRKIVEVVVFDHLIC